VTRFHPTSTAIQTTLTTGDKITATATKSTAELPWPKSLAEQIQAVRTALTTFAAPVDAATLATTFKSAKADRIEEILETLAGLGQARALADGRFPSRYESEAFVTHLSGETPFRGGGRRCATPDHFTRSSSTVRGVNQDLWPNMPTINYQLSTFSSPLHPNLLEPLHHRILHLRLAPPVEQDVHLRSSEGTPRARRQLAVAGVGDLVHVT